MSSHPWLERAIEPETGTTALYAYLPYEGSSNRRWLRRALGSNRIHLKPVQRHGLTVWRLGRRHMLPLAAAMADKYGEIEMRIEFSRTMVCDTNCQDADPSSVFKCVCKCGGEDHGGIGQHSDWYRSGRTTLVRTEKTEVQQVTITRGQIRLRAPDGEAPEPTTERTQPPTPRPQPLDSKPAPQLQQPHAPEPVSGPVVVPAEHRFGDVGRTPSQFVAQASSQPPRPTPAPGRSRVGIWVTAALLAVAALGGGTWLVTHTNQHADVSQVTNQETPQPSSSPEPSPAALLPPTEEAAAPTSQFPAGCYPFQPDC